MTSACISTIAASFLFQSFSLNTPFHHCISALLVHSSLCFYASKSLHILWQVTQAWFQHNFFGFLIKLSGKGSSGLWVSLLYWSIEYMFSGISLSINCYLWSLLLCLIFWVLCFMYFYIELCLRKVVGAKPQLKGHPLRPQKVFEMRIYPSIHLFNLLVSLGLLRKLPYIGFLSMLSQQSFVETNTSRLSSEVSCSWEKNSSKLI